MAEPYAACVGAIPSADIAVPEHDRELRFYSRVLTTGARPLWRDDLMNNRGMPVIGLGRRTAQYEHLPLQWMPHVQVADVAMSVQRAVERGGSELVHDDQSRWAVLRDPDGAAFGIIPVVPADAMPAADGGEAPVGRICGVELTVPDAAASRDFYRQVIGWSVRDVELQHAGERHVDYELCDADGRPAARICDARGASRGLPPTWLLHLPVGDLAESVRRVASEGGNVVAAPQSDGGAGVRAVVRDLVGCYLALVADQAENAP